MSGMMQILLSVAAAYPVTFTTVRILGKKQIATMTFWDLVSAIALGSLAANAVVDRQRPMLHSVLAVVAWGAVTLATDYLVLKSRTLRRIIQGRPAILIANGQIQESVLRRERLNIDLLRGELRAQGAFTVSEVDWAVIEPNGKVTVQKASAKQTPTRSDLTLPEQPTGPSIALVVEGKIATQMLQEIGLDQEWLLAELAKAGSPDLQSLFYVDFNPDGTLEIQKREQKGTRLTTLG